MRYCGHGVALDRECRACVIQFESDERRRQREAKMREVLSNARTLLLPHVGDDIVMKTMIAEIDGVLNQR